MNSKRKGRIAAVAGHDLANPKPGTRLLLGEIAAELKVTVSDMVEATGLGRASVARLLTNDWPVRTDNDQVKDALRRLMAARGATPEQQATLFHAHGPRSHHVATPNRDGYDRPLDRPALQPKEEEPEMLIPRQTLTREARVHFKLMRNPFEGDVIDDSQMFNGAEVAYVREAVWQCALTGSFVAITGESGAGKTTVLSDLEQRILDSGRNVVLLKPNTVGMEKVESKGKVLRTADIMHDIILQLKPDTTVPQGPSARTSKAVTLLQSGVQAGNVYLLVIEEAHRLADAGLKHMKQMHELKHGRRPLLGILLLAQPELKHRLAAGLADGSLREVAQRCELVELLPLDADLKPYLATRCSAVGAQLAQLISDDGVEGLRDKLTLRDRSNPKRAVSMCYPLAVNNWMTRLLNKAAEIGEPKVTADVVKAL